MIKSLSREAGFNTAREKAAYGHGSTAGVLCRGQSWRKGAVSVGKAVRTRPELEAAHLEYQHTRLCPSKLHKIVQRPSVAEVIATDIRYKNI